MATIVTRAVKGSALTHTEMDANFNNLNTDKPDVIGTPVTDNIATFDANDDVQDSGYAIEDLYPVGSIYMNASVSTNPGTLLGFGTWVAFGAGRVPVGIDTGDTDFDTVEETGGAKTHTLVEGEIPAHDHGSAGSHTHSIDVHNSTGSGSYRAEDTLSTTGVLGTRSTNSGGSHTHASVGGDGDHNNLQPYIVAYMWKRTA